MSTTAAPPSLPARDRVEVLRVWATAMAPLACLLMMVRLTVFLADNVVNSYTLPLPTESVHATATGGAPRVVPRGPGVIVGDSVYVVVGTDRVATYRPARDTTQSAPASQTDSLGRGAPPLLSRDSGALPFSELIGRLSWSLTVLLIALTGAISLVAILLALRVVRNPGVRTMLQVVIAAALPLLFLFHSDVNRDTFVFSKLILNATVYPVSGAARNIVAGIEAVGHTVLLGLAVSACAVLYRSEHPGWRGEVRDPHRAALTLARHQRILRTLLYLGAAVLVAGTLETTALYGWAETLFAKDGSYLRTGDTLTEIGTLTGSFYSLFLASVFVPTFALLRRKADRLADEANPSSSVADRAKWLADYSIDAPVPKQLMSVLAVAAPLLAGGPLAKVLELITS